MITRKRYASRGLRAERRFARAVETHANHSLRRGNVNSIDTNGESVDDPRSISNDRRIATGFERIADLTVTAARSDIKVVLEDGHFASRKRHASYENRRHARAIATSTREAIIATHTTMRMIRLGTDFTTIGDRGVAIEIIREARGNDALRGHTAHHRIRSHTRQTTPSAIVDIRCRIHFTTRFGIHVAIEFRGYAIGELASARDTSRDRIGSFARIATRSAMVETGRRIGFTTIVIKIIAILPLVVAARNGARARYASDIRVDDRNAGFIANTAMVQTGGRIRFANRVRIPVAFGKTRRTTTAPLSALSALSTLSASASR